VSCILKDIEKRNERIWFILCGIHHRLYCRQGFSVRPTPQTTGICDGNGGIMNKEQARMLARKIYNLPKGERTQTLGALDTDSRILVVKELYYLRGDAPPGKAPSCS